MKMTITAKPISGVLAAALAVGWAGPAAAATAAEKCEAAKLKASGTKAKCLLGAEAVSLLTGNAPKIERCVTNFEKAFDRAGAKAGPGVCPTEADAGAVEALVDACAADVAAALSDSPTPPSPCHQFAATGQTTCWNSGGAVISCAGTGQDGDIRAGAALSYTDHGDGTITDHNTGLMWEKKSDDGSIHDKDNSYTRANAFTVHIAGLNSGPCFAGHCDWRLPNVKKLQSIVNYQTGNPALSPAFNNNCVADATVLTGSCTHDGVSYYWSSTHLYDGRAWLADFHGGTVFGVGKNDYLFVRAVRGGSL